MKSRFIKRRHFLGLTLGLGLSSFSSRLKANSSTRIPSVLILGAGLSGLYGALLLERAGFLVTILEGRDRIGGRIHTLKDLPGSPEAGAQGLSNGYSRLLSLGSGYGIQFQRRQRSARAKILFYIDGKVVSADRWASSDVNQLSQAEKHILPPRLMTHYLRSNNPLQNPEDWISSQYWQLDISLANYLKRQGASDEALRLMNVYPFSMNQIDSASALWGLRNDLLSQNPTSKPMRLIGGNSLLPENLAANLSSSIYLGKIIEEIRSSSEQVTVYCGDGSSYSADYALCTLPFSVLRQIKIDPPLQGKQKEAVNNLPYTRVTQIHLSFKNTLKKRENIALRLWSDSILEQIFPVKDEQGKVKGLTIWANGDNADRLDRLSTRQISQVVKSQLAKINPDLTNMVDIKRVTTWGSDPFSLGAYSHFAPGQISQFSNIMARPWQRIYFAGEHTGIIAPGMEKALESSERAVEELLAILR